MVGELQRRIANTHQMLLLLGTNISTTDWCDALLKGIATHVVGDRPHRFEPRLRKRRPKQYKHLREPPAKLQKKVCRMNEL
jgi:hypothetical protein